MKFENLFGELPKEIISPFLERRLSQRLPSKIAQKQLATASMWEAVVFLRSCASNIVSTEELFSMAWASLTRAARNYQPRNNVRFFDYAKHYLRGTFRRTLRLQSTVVRNAAGQVSFDLFGDLSEDKPGDKIENLLRRESLVPTSYDFDRAAMESEDELRELAPMLLQLSKSDRLLLHQKFFQQQTYTEIAIRKRVSRQAVEARIKRILRRLRWMVKLDRLRRGITE